MIQGFGKFWNIFSYFWKKLLDAFLLSFICHTAVKYATGKDMFEISGILLLVTFVLGIVVAVIHAIRIAKPENTDKPIIVFNREPNAINVDKSIKSDVNVKAHRFTWKFIKNVVLFIVVVALFYISVNVGAHDFAGVKLPWITSVVLIACCVFYNLYINKPSRRCRCPVCKRGKAIKFVDKELLEQTKGDWTERSERLDYETEVHEGYYYDDKFGKHYYRDETKKPVIREDRTEHHNVALGKHKKSYICRYCGQHFTYEDTRFEALNK